MELEYEGYEVFICEDGKSGLESALNNEFDLIFLQVILLLQKVW